MTRAALMRRLSLVLALTAGSASADVEGTLDQYEQEARQISQTLPTLDDSTKAPPNRRLVDAQVAFSLGNYDDAAVTLFELAGRGGPEQEPATFYLAETLYAKGDKGAARSYYQSIVEKNATGSKYYQPSLLRLIEIAIAQNDPTEVDATIAAIDRASPAIPNAAYVKAKWAFSQGRYDDAIAQFAQVPKGSTFEAQAAYYTATAYVAKKDLQKAQELFTQVSQRVPTSANDRRVMELADLALGRLYYERDQLGKAIDSYLMIDRSSDLFPDALYEVGWVYVKNKQYDKALRALELLALSNPNSNRTATVRILEGNLHIRKAQMNRVAQVENTVDASAVDPAVEYAKATDVFTQTHDAYYPSYVALEAMLENKDSDPADYLAQLAERETSVFQAVAPIPDAAAQYLREEPETQRIVANQQDLGTIKAHLTESESTIARLEAVIAANDKSVVYPAMQSKRERIASIQRDLIAMRNDLAEQQIALTTGDASVVQLASNRKALYATFSTAPDGEANHGKIVETDRASYDALSQQAEDIRTAIDESEAMAVASRKYVTEKYDGPALVTDEQRASAKTELVATAGEITAVEAELRDIKAELIVGRDLAGAHDDGLSAGVAQRRAMKAAQDAEQHALDGASSRDSGRSKKLAELADKAMRISDDLAATETKIDQSIDKALGEAKELLAKERANVDSYNQELAGYELESRAIGGTILGASFANVKAKFYDVIVRTDVGAIDVSWAQKEDADDDLKRLNLSRARELKLITDEFCDILEPSQMQIPTLPPEKPEPTSANPNPTAPPTAGSPDKGANERVKPSDEKGVTPAAPTVRPDNENQSQKQPQKTAPKTTPTAQKGATK
ncbi:hypothetical protein BH11MYX2_BH11MYX2_17650 [soil metagenome]